MRESKSKDVLPFTCTTDTSTSHYRLHKGDENSEICTEQNSLYTCAISRNARTCSRKISISFASMDLFITKQTKGNKIDYQHIMCHFIQNDFSSYFPFLYRFDRKDNEIQPQRPRHTSQTKDNHNVVALQFMNAFLMFFIFVSSCFICVVLCIIFTSKKCFFISLFSLLAERKKLHNPRAT